MSVDNEPRSRLDRIDRELALLPRGQLVVRRREGSPWVFRIWKEGARTLSEAVGEVGGREHMAMATWLERRRDLSRERRLLGRCYD
ncbi:MAG TPA: hypothetical protein PKO15_09640 [Fibrobacteria bacterium]|nr:hypothetical protein [Fibrobacteria bacterium]HOX50790.1 hypothetical protein [Fibrobacteria bacterium]